MLCPPGTFSNTAGSSSCTACANTRSSLSRSTSCSMPLSCSMISFDISRSQYHATGTHSVRLLWYVLNLMEGGSDTYQPTSAPCSDIDNLLQHESLSSAGDAFQGVLPLCNVPYDENGRTTASKLGGYTQTLPNSEAAVCRDGATTVKATFNLIKGTSRLISSISWYMTTCVIIFYKLTASRYQYRDMHSV